jgi:Tfp pilus assembly protein PilV
MILEKCPQGLTLIEILIAVIVLTVGVLSILSLFPNAIKSTKLTVEDSVASNIAESVADALVIAMRWATLETSNSPSTAILVHDGLPENSYEFALPLTANPPPEENETRYFAHPSSNPLDAKTPNPYPIDVFKLGKTPYIKNVLADVRKGPDPTESYDQYAFSFTVSRIDDARTLQERPKSLFRFAILVYRLKPDYKQGDEIPEPIKVFVIDISGK